MPTTPSGIHYPDSTDAPDVPADLQELAERVDLIIASNEVVTALPTTDLFEGKEINYLADATNGVIWRLKYRGASASSYKWEFIGGSPLQSVSTGVVIRSFDTYGDPNIAGSPGPSVTAPLAGEYFVHLQAKISPGGSASGYASYDIGATAASDNDALHTYFEASFITGSRRDLKTIAAAAVVAMKYRSSSAGINMSFSQRTIALTPKRVI